MSKLNEVRIEVITKFAQIHNKNQKNGDDASQKKVLSYKNLDIRLPSRELCNNIWKHGLYNSDKGRYFY